MVPRFEFAEVQLSRGQSKSKTSELSQMLDLDREIRA
jgi:hypothetical protein